MPSMTTIRETHDVAARTGRGFEVEAGELIRVTDLEGSQPVDFWAFSKADHLEFLSCEHTKPSIEKLFPHVGDSAYTNRRRRIVTVVDDTSPGQHDMQYAACDPTRYAELGVEGYHESCQENLHTALEGFGIALQVHAAALEPVHQFLHQPGWHLRHQGAGIQAGRLHRAPGRDGGHHRGLRLPPGSEPHLRRPANRHPGRGRTLTWCGRRPFRRSPAPPSAAGNGRTKSAA